MTDKLIDKIADMASPMIRELGFELADAELIKEGANWYLRFFIEHTDTDLPITTDDCQQVSERLSDWLDEADPIPQSYFLEVSSPGVERPLKKAGDFARFQGRMVQVNLYAPFEGEKVFLGSLGPATDTELTIRREGRDITLSRENIALVRLHWEDDQA